MAEMTSFFTDGAAYERFMGRWSRAAGEVFIDWLSVPPGLLWLDVGCGTGVFTELVLDRCAPKAISAIDPAEDQIAYAGRRLAATQATFRVGDAQSLPYADGMFDVAAMALVIVFVPNPAKAVGEMMRVVKPGGTVATYMWDILGKGFTQQPLIDALEAMNVKAPTLPGHVNSRLDNLKGFFETSGLTEITTRTIDIEVSYANFDDYWSSQTGLHNPTVQSIRKMTGSDVERLKASLRERLSTDGDRRIAYPARANAIKGRVPE
jgi:ubiquinone/menaquinone biosynthesis C-methylase UbiE